MSEFSELIKNFDKIREYVRDFYIYGFKTRGNYTAKSARTYDNERRRIESWLSRYIRWENSAKGKRVFLSVDSARIPQNPLYAAWKSKSFTKSDIMLHFFLLDLLRDGNCHTVEQLTNDICERYQVIFDAQTVRIKLREYCNEGIVVSHKEGKRLLYRLSTRNIAHLACRGDLLNAVKFFQEISPFGYIGSTILDQQGLENDLFYFKHHFIVHTLDDSILYQLLSAIAGHRRVCLENRSRRTGNTTVISGVPIRILTSVQTGRRYVCVYRESLRRYLNIQLDSISSVLVGEEIPRFGLLQSQLSSLLPACWGVSFGERHRKEQLFMKLRIDEEHEWYLIDRLRREIRGGELLLMERDTFLFSIETFDANEMLSWVKSFIGRILSLECTNPYVSEKFHRDIERMYTLYCREEI